MKPSAIDWYHKFVNGISEKTPDERYGYLTALYIEGLIDIHVYKQELAAIKENNGHSGSKDTPRAES